MHTTRFQRTIARPVSVGGFGYWGGRDVVVEFRPAPADTGIVFVREDLPSPVEIPARITQRIEEPRRTTLAQSGARVEMVEHILAALAGLGIDNCQVAVDQAEMPGCDGSALPFVAALDQAGGVSQSAPRACLIVREVTRVGNDEGWIEARPATQPGLTIRFRLDYGRDNAIGRQTYEQNITPESFRQQIAPSRTFLLKAEADWIRSQGKGQRTGASDLLIFDEMGPIDNPLRFADECVRHKILDMVGDLSLSGCDLIGHLTAHRSGHRLNAELVRVLLAENEIVTGWRRSA